MRLSDTLTKAKVELPRAAWADPHVRLRLDGLPPCARRQREAVRARHVAQELAAANRLRRHARPQHHGRRRQGLRRGRRPRGGEPRPGRVGDGLVRGGHRPSRAGEAGRRAARVRDDAGDHRVHRGAARARSRVRGAGGRVLPCRSLRGLRAPVGRQAGRDGCPGAERAARRILATSRSGRRRNPSRTQPGTRRGAPAGPAGTSSALRWPRSI